MNLHALLRNRAADGELWIGEGGYAVYGRLMPAEDSTALVALPIGLAQESRSARGGEGGDGEVAASPSASVRSQEGCDAKWSANSCMGAMSLRTKPHIRVSEHRVTLLDGQVCRVNQHSSAHRRST